MKNILKSILLTLLFSSVYGQSIDTALDSLFLRWNNDLVKQPGIAASIIKDGTPIYQKTFGSANLEYHVKLSRNSVFDIASLAKQFTGFAIAKLELDGKLKLAEPLSEYFPEMEDLLQGMTIQHLIHHTSGLRDIGELFDIGHFGSELTLEKTIEIMRKQRSLNFQPGSESDYSNTNYVLLARIVEIITEKTFRKWCDENIFRPLEMTSSFANDNPQEIIPNRAVAYYENQGDFTFDQNNGMSLIGSSAVYSTISDLEKWAMNLLSNPSYQKLFSKMQNNGSLIDGTTVDYGFGLATRDHKNKKMVFHSGSTPSGFRTSIALFPEEKSAIILLSNFGNIDLLRQFQLPIFDIIFDVNTKDTEVNLEEESLVFVQLSPQEKENIIGDYLFNGERKVKIRSSESGLTVQPEGAPEMELNPISSNEIYFPGFKSTIVFEKNNGGLFEKATIISGGEKAGSLSRVEAATLDQINLDHYIGNYYNEELNLLWTIESFDDQIVINDSKHGSIHFNSISRHSFRADPRMNMLLKFEEDSENSVSSLKINRGSRLRNLTFVKMD